MNLKQFIATQNHTSTPMENKPTLVKRYAAHAAKAENTGAVNTHTVSTERGMFKD